MRNGGVVEVGRRVVVYKIIRMTRKKDERDNGSIYTIRERERE